MEGIWESVGKVICREATIQASFDLVLYAWTIS